MEVLIRVDTVRRDDLTRIAADLGGVSVDEALRVLIVEHRTHAPFAGRGAYPGEASSCAEESATPADIDVDVRD